MLKERARFIGLAFLLADLLLIAAAFALAYWTRDTLLPRLGLGGSLYPFVEYLPLLPIALVLWAVLLSTSKRYHSHRTTSLASDAAEILRLSLGATLLLFLAIYLFRLDAALLGEKPGGSFYVGPLSAPKVIQLPSAAGTTVTWRATTQSEGGKYRLYASRTDTGMKLLEEVEARVGRADYSVEIPDVEGTRYFFELRFVDRRGRETLVHTAVVHDLISRAFILLFGIWAAVLLMLQTAAVRGLARAVRRRGFNYRRVVIVGTGAAALEIESSIQKHPGWGLHLLGFVTSNGDSGAATPVLGSQQNLPKLSETTVIDQVIFATDHQEFEDLEDLALQLEELGIGVVFALNLFPRTRAKAHLADMGGTPVLTFTTGPTNQLHLFLKRMGDVAMSAIALVVLSPLLAIIALVVKATSKGPVFFNQERCGLNGRRFTLHKFRTMVADAESRRDEVSDLNEMDGPVFKAVSDPRITAAGRVLRKFSMDELPQLWNVLRGDMSLVGPRPPLPAEVTQYKPWQRRRLSMRPGLTCLWQISGRNRVDFDRWMALDLEYIDSWSPRLDFEILMKTIPAVLSGRGAS